MHSGVEVDEYVGDGEAGLEDHKADGDGMERGGEAPRGRGGGAMRRH